MTTNVLLSSIAWLLVTTVSFLLALRFYKAMGRNAIFHPLITSVAIVLTLLYFSQTSVQHYQRYTSILHWLLGPATIALAVPLYDQLQVIKKTGVRLLVPIVVGGTCAPLIALLVVWLAGAEQSVIASMLPKSITTPLAMDAAKLMGGYPALAAVFVIITGVIGAVFASLVFRLQPGLSERSKGLALGTVAHAVGTAQAFTISDKAGAFSSLALCINGILTAVILPILYFWLI